MIAKWIPLDPLCIIDAIYSIQHINEYCEMPIDRAFPFRQIDLSYIFIRIMMFLN